VYPSYRKPDILHAVVPNYLLDVKKLEVTINAELSCHYQAYKPAL